MEKEHGQFYCQTADSVRKTLLAFHLQSGVSFRIDLYQGDLVVDQQAMQLPLQENAWNTVLFQWRQGHFMTYTSPQDFQEITTTLRFEHAILHVGGEWRRGPSLGILSTRRNLFLQAEWSSTDYRDCGCS